MYTVQYEDLKRLIYDALVQAGLPSEQAKAAAEYMGYADLHGTDTHGILRLPIYVKKIQTGSINKQPRYKIDRETDNSAILDADNGMGHYFMDMAVKMAIEKAEKNTLAFVLVRNSNHFGALALYAGKSGRTRHDQLRDNEYGAPYGSSRWWNGWWEQSACFAVPRRSGAGHFGYCFK